MLIRPMRPPDLAAALAISNDSFRIQRDDASSARWLSKARHLVRTDPGGCWVAEDDRSLIGFAISLRRELLWALASYNVAPQAQGRGVGRELLRAASEHAQGCLRAMLSSSADPKAVRRYLQAGFELHPLMEFRGVPELTAADTRQVRVGAETDLALMDSVDRRIRHAGHGPDHRWLAGAGFRCAVIDRPNHSGYVWYDEQGTVQLLAASDRRSATRLLWQALAHARASAADPVVRLSRITGANQWAVRTAVAAGLRVHTEGFLATRGMKPPAPYLPHGSFL